VRRFAALFLVLAGAARAEPEGAGGPFDPLAPGLAPLSRAAFEQLGPIERLRARGFDPLAYRRPPPADDRVPQHNNVRRRLHPGFSYRRRLEEKQRAFRRLVTRMPPDRMAALMREMVELDPRAFARRYGHAIPVRRPFLPQQSIQARRHSERQFREWALGEIAVRLLGATGRDRKRAVQSLVRGLRDDDARLARRCAQVLGRLPDDAAAEALEQTVLRARDPELLGAAVSARLRRGATETLVRRWARHSRPAVRFAVARACRTLSGDWVDAFAERRVERAEGRERDDWAAVLAARRFVEEPRDGDVSFFGIRTHSRRVLYLLDVSGSMAYLMDGKGGEREPRIERTRRELLRSLTELPDDVRFNVALFASAVRPWERRLRPVGGGTRTAAMDYLEEREVKGGTNIHGALAFALESGADTAFLLTDGEASVGTVVDPALILAEAAARTRHGRLVVHTVGLARDQNAELLVNLAHRTGGRYVAVR